MAEIKTKFYVINAVVLVADLLVAAYFYFYNDNENVIRMCMEEKWGDVEYVTVGISSNTDVKIELKKAKEILNNLNFEPQNPSQCLITPFKIYIKGRNNPIRITIHPYGWVCDDSGAYYSCNNKEKQRAFMNMHTGDTPAQ